MLDDELLNCYMGRFFGYGNVSAKLWFIGMEEGGGGSVEEIGSRLSAWDVRGRKAVEDIAEYHLHFGLNKFFTGEKPPTQRTWAKLIRATIVGNGETPEVYAVRDYQKCNWGRLLGETCLLELLPLPSPGISAWHYGNISELSFLSTRKKYKEYMVGSRMRAIKSMIQRHNPRVVVFYGKTYQKYWNEIAGPEVEWLSSDWGSKGGGSQVGYFLVNHPSSRGASNALFNRLGLELRKDLAP